jgi:hypothetical protein
VRILSRARSYIAGFGEPWCRGFRISSSTLCGRNVSLYSPFFTTRAILRFGPGAKTVPVNRRIDTNRFAAGHAERYAAHETRRRLWHQIPPLPPVSPPAPTRL